MCLFLIALAHILISWTERGINLQWILLLLLLLLDEILELCEKIIV